MNFYKLATRFIQQLLPEYPYSILLYLQLYVLHSTVCIEPNIKYAWRYVLIYLSQYQFGTVHNRGMHSSLNCLDIIRPVQWALVTFLSNPLVKKPAGSANFFLVSKLMYSPKIVSRASPQTGSPNFKNENKTVRMEKSIFDSRLIL
jgi:hypothetical protein